MMLKVRRFTVFVRKKSNVLAYYPVGRLKFFH